MRKNYILKILFIFCLIILLHSFLLILKWEKENRINNGIIDELDNIYQNNLSDSSKNNSFIFVNSDKEENNSSYWYYVSMNMLNVNFDEFNKKNNDTKGWIYVPGTDINYPFVQSKDNKFYLNHSFDKKYNSAGWIYLDYRNDINNLSKNNIIYGHARRDKSMFGTLKNVLKKDWFEDEDNHVIKISTEKENTLWKVFSVYHTKTDPYYITVNFTDDEFSKYINQSLDKSIYSFDTNVYVDDIILTLSTCYGDSEKLILQAKLIKKEIKNN
jgi:sortase B